MNNIKSIMAGLLLTAGIWAGCSEDVAMPVPEIPDGNKVTLTYSIDEVKMSRAAGGVTFENRVTKLDVFVFDNSGSKKYHQAVDNLDNSTGTITLNKELFDPNTPYQVHLIANSANADLANIQDLPSLKQALETTASLYLTQEASDDLPGGIPTKFLMHGTEKVVLHDGGTTIFLKRAAAKIQVILEEGLIKNDDGTTTDNLFQFAGSGVEFNFVNYHENTRYIYDDTDPVGENLLKSTAATSSAQHIAYSSSDGTSPKTVTITTYAYANEWQSDSENKMTHLVVRLPYIPSGETEAVENNYYKIPLSKDYILEPNHLYTVRVKLSTAGSTSISNPIELKEVEYSVLGWINQEINVGGGEPPHYLSLNKEELEMKNITEDNTLVFASSSPVEIQENSMKVYYYNKYGVKTEVTDSEILKDIRITPDQNINGKITIDSPTPTNNLIRYIEFTVTNNDPNCEDITVTVKQYPQEYITYYFGYYSYREDFKFHWENRNVSPKYVTSYWQNNKWNFSQATSSRSRFFGSKVVQEQPDNGYGTQVGYDIEYYYWESGSMETSDSETKANPRMYHVQINSSALPKFPYDAAFEQEHSGFQYELGIPRMEEGYTAQDDANGKLVSPSFMIASRLGAVNRNLSDYNDKTAYEMASTHCDQYVEVYYPRDEKGYRIRKNGQPLPAVTLSDWRLPTKAELLIIMRYQGTSNKGTDAMDYLLNWGYYMSASGKVRNPHHNDSAPESTAIRCVRDHYDNKGNK